MKIIFSHKCVFSEAYTHISKLCKWNGENRHNQHEMYSKKPETELQFLFSGFHGHWSVENQGENLADLFSLFHLWGYESIHRAKSGVLKIIKG